MRPSGPFSDGERDISIDIAKVFGILLVVLGHCGSPFPLEKMIYSFHMPLFFMISGLLYKSRDIVPTLRNKWNSLLKPYFMAAIITLPMLWVVGEGKLFDAHLIVRILEAKNETLIWNTPLWFLPSLFVTIILFVLIESGVKNILVTALIGMAAGVFVSYLVPPVRHLLFFGLDTAVPALFFFSLGVVAARKNTLRNPSPAWNLIAFALCFALWAASRIVGHHPYFVMAKYRITPNVLFFLTGVVGSFAVLFLARFLDLVWKRKNSGLPLKLLMFLSSSMFGIYLFHKPVIMLVQRYFPSLGSARVIVFFLAGVIISSGTLALIRAVSPRVATVLTGSR